MKKPSLAFAPIAVGAATLIASAAALSRPAPAVHTEKRSYAFSSVAQVKVRLKFANLRIVTSELPGIEVEATRWADLPTSDATKNWIESGDLLVKQHDGTVTIDDSPLRGPNGLSGVKREHETIVLNLPEKTQLHLDMGAGVVLTSGRFTALMAHLGSGQFDANLADEMPGSSEIQLGAGDLHVSLPAGANERIEASTEDGQISGLPASGEPSGNGSAHRSVGVTGSGSRRLELRVGSGSVNVASKDPIVELADSDHLAQSHGEADQDSELLAEGLRQARMAMQSKDVNQAIEKAFAEARVELRKSSARIGPEVRRALAKIRKEIKRSTPAEREQMRREMAKIPTEMDREMREVEQELARVSADLKLKPGMDGLSPSNRESAESIIQEVRRAVREALRDVQQQLKETTH